MSDIASNHKTKTTHLSLNAHHRPKVGAEDLQSLLCVAERDLLPHLVPERTKLFVALRTALPQAEDRHSGGLAAKELLRAVERRKASVLQLHQASASPERHR